MPKNKKSLASKGLSAPSKSAQPRDRLHAVPVAVGTQFRASRPKIKFDGSRCLVSHTERFGGVVGSASFSTTNYAINPGNVFAFPWLSSLALRFEKYRFKKLKCHYRTKCSTSNPGDISLAIDYDASDLAPGSSVIMENYEDAVNTAPWMDVVLQSTKLNLNAELWYYVRDYHTLAANLDIKTYDTGKLFVGVEGNGTDILGYLYWEYEIELLTTALDFVEDPPVGGYTTGATYAGTLTKILGSEPFDSPWSDGYSWDQDYNSVVFDLPGDYLIVIACTNNGLSSVSAAPYLDAEVIEQSFTPIGSPTVTGGIILVYARINTYGAAIDFSPVGGDGFTAGRLSVGRAPWHSLSMTPPALPPLRNRVRGLRARARTDAGVQCSLTGPPRARAEAQTSSLAFATAQSRPVNQRSQVPSASQRTDESADETDSGFVSVGGAMLGPGGPQTTATHVLSDEEFARRKAAGTLRQGVCLVGPLSELKRFGLR